MSEKDLISTTEAAQILGISTSTLTRRVADGVIKAATVKSPHLKRPKSLQFEREYIERLARKSS